jgi:hypothetical protein
MLICAPFGIIKGMNYNRVVSTGAGALILITLAFIAGSLILWQRELTEREYNGITASSVEVLDLVE